MNSEIAKITEISVNALDLTPFNEPIIVNIVPWMKGYKVDCKMRINYRWGTECEWIEANRIFGHKGNLNQEEMATEFVKAMADMHEKRLWIFKANHGLLDHDGSTIRYKA